MLNKVLLSLYKEHHFTGNPVMKNHVRRGLAVSIVIYLKKEMTNFLLIYHSYRYYTKFPMLKKDTDKAALVDNFTHVPLAYMPAFYLTDGFLQGKSAKQIYEDKFKTGEYTKTTLACMVVWVPFQMWNFRKIPLEFQCLTVQGAALFWNIVLSYWNSGPDQYSSVI